MSNSKLVSYILISPNKSSRDGAKIDRITIHHMAGNLSVEQCGYIFSNSSRQASSNYGIGSDGRVGLYVAESNRSWSSSNYANDRRAVTIEVANNSGAPNWTVSDKALDKTIELCVDICRRNGIKKLTPGPNGNLTQHNYYAATICPGLYLKSKFDHIANEVNKRLEVVLESLSKPVGKKSDDTIANEVIAGKWGNGETRKARLQQADYSYSIIQALVNKKLGINAVSNAKSNDQIASEVIRGEWGNGQDRANKLTKAGYNYHVIQNIVNRRLGY